MKAGSRGIGARRSPPRDEALGPAGLRPAFAAGAHSQQKSAPRDWLWLSVNRLWTGAAVYQAANQRDKHAEHSAQYQAKSEDHRLLWLNGVG